MAILSERETRAISGAAIGAAVGGSHRRIVRRGLERCWRFCRRTAWSHRPFGEIRTMKPSELFTIETAMAVGVALALGSCARFDPLGFGVLNPPPGLTFVEFQRATSKSLLGYPQAVTSPGIIMIYNLPGNREALYWFENGRFVKKTRRDPEDPNAWTRPISSVPPNAVVGAR